ncbi:hypothetical protein KC343_g3895 [Hortaea werneckii]|nr:hypothetical protein KC352_g9910 [Hortaea werneckii]KAI7570940.1 hypothetical protein KC317_g2047 [Hortaea werneckii]KAI7625409.1 hypothetical protein KC346_g1742 [Hortaea werneckii]KAI7631636.1 hypothetical protein KC343_g3895 [Hortaea werneckii]KAI7675885.1 hypothetical protein KC319_g4475 [Hortaea werneckii]
MYHPSQAFSRLSVFFFAVIAIVCVGSIAADLDMVARASSEVFSDCVGDASGRKIGVEACVDVQFTGPDSIAFDLNVTDTGCDSHPVYGYFKVYYPYWTINGQEYRLLPNGQLPNDNECAPGNTVSVKGKPWEAGADYLGITGVRVYGCVADWGPNTCTEGDLKGEWFPNRQWEWP